MTSSATLPGKLCQSMLVYSHIRWHSRDHCFAQRLLEFPSFRRNVVHTCSWTSTRCQHTWERATQICGVLASTRPLEVPSICRRTQTSPLCWTNSCQKHPTKWWEKPRHFTNKDNAKALMSMGDAWKRARHGGAGAPTIKEDVPKCAGRGQQRAHLETL